jgi:hypothetical protein
VKITAVLKLNKNLDMAKMIDQTVIFLIKFLFFASLGAWIFYTNVCTIRDKVVGGNRCTHFVRVKNSVSYGKLRLLCCIFS